MNQGKIYLLLLVFLSTLFFAARPSPSQFKRIKKKLPDLVVTAIRIDKSCRLVVEVMNRGPGRIPDTVYTRHHRKSPGVMVTINSKSWGGQAIWYFDKKRGLQKPNGRASCVLNLKIEHPLHVVARIDSQRGVAEINERNNSFSRSLKGCRYAMVPNKGLTSPIVTKKMMMTGIRLSGASLSKVISAKTLKMTGIVPEVKGLPDIIKANPLKMTGITPGKNPLPSGFTTKALNMTGEGN